MPQLNQSMADTFVAGTILDVIELVLCHFDPESAGGTAEICDSISACLNNDVVANSFWDEFQFYSDAPEKNRYANIACVVNSQIRLLPLDIETSFR